MLARFTPPSPRLFRYAILGIAVALLIAAAAAVTLGLTQAQAANGKYDTDGDRLIDVSSLEQLDAIRCDTDGDGRDASSDCAQYAKAFPVSGEETVCDRACRGYELTRSLDFNSADSYGAGTVNAAWAGGDGWSPISGFNAEFEGNGNTISGLYIYRPDDSNVGLFETTGSASEIRNIGLVNADVIGKYAVGALAGVNYGAVMNSYATGSVGSRRGDSPTERSGGLAGRNSGTITASYATASVEGGNYVGGLVGYSDGAAITASYATGSVTGNSHVGGLVGGSHDVITTSYATGSVTGNSSVGGLVGLSNEAITASYATGSVTGDQIVGGLVGYQYSGDTTATYATGSVTGDSSVGGLVGYRYSGTITVSYFNTDVTSRDNYGTGATTAQLQSPTGYTGIYADWRAGGRQWEFGSGSQYPVLKADIDGDGTATWQEFGNQHGYASTLMPTPTPAPTATSTPPPTAGPSPTPGPEPTATPVVTDTQGTTPTPAPVLSSGFNHSCLLRSDGSAFCWDSGTGDQGAPSAGAKFTAISSGFSHACGLKTDQTIVCWGDNSDGKSTPPSGQFTAISSGFAHTCGLRTDGTAACWGENPSGQATPPEDTLFTLISSGLAHTCAQRVDGAVVCWGSLSGTFAE